MGLEKAVHPPVPLFSNRWVQLAAGVLGMVAVSNLQYGWTYFVEPLHEKYHWDKAGIQLAITLFILAETWLVPIEAYMAESYGPRRMVFAGGVLVALAWALNSMTDTL